MSKKTQKKAEKKEKIVNEAPVEEKSKVEKIISYVIYGICASLILLVILLSINCHGDAGKLAKKYDSLTNDNIFEILDFKELQEKIANGETFDLLLINTKFENAEYYIYCVDIVAKNVLKEEVEGFEKVYVFDTYKLKDEETKFFKDVKYNILKEPNIISYATTIEDYSVVVDSTIFYDVEEHFNNQFYLINDYFKKLYLEIEESYE